MAQAAKAQTFSSVLDIPSSEIERPKPLPVGSYIGVVQGQPRIDKSAKKQTEFSEYTIKLLQAMEDVDTDALKAIGGIKDKTVKVTFYHTENSIYRLKEFFEHCGIDTDTDASPRQLMAEVAGCQVGITIAHQASDDGTTVYANVKNTFKVE